jgi:RimJ/RimL family protein N-acetyltransferase
MPPTPEPWSDGEVALRRWRSTDVPAIVAACQDPEIPRWTVVPEGYTERDALTWLASEAGNPALLGLAIVDAGDDERLLGSIGLHLHATEPMGEIGYWVAREARGRGVACRGVDLLAHWALTEAALARLQILVEPANHPSQRVALRAGFTQEGLLRSIRDIKGRRRDLISFSLLPEDLDGHY